jgi:YhcG PDDEXK nuclease domain
MEKVWATRNLASRLPYFLTITDDAHERELQRGLLVHVRQFLLELGAGFAFVGENIHLEVAGEDFYVDLLFFHLKLRCYVVVDLKVRSFQPEFAGKMNFYLSAVDDLLRHPDDKPSLGLILCKSGNQTIAEYALRDIAKPVGVSSYVTRLVESLPANLQGSLPTVAELEAELQSAPAAETPPASKSRRPKNRP